MPPELYTNYLFSSSYGLLILSDRLELVSFQGHDEHKDAAMQEWFEHVRERLKPHEAPKCPECGYIARACLGCGRPDC